MYTGVTQEESVGSNDLSVERWQHTLNSSINGIGGFLVGVFSFSELICSELCTDNKLTD